MTSCLLALQIAIRIQFFQDFYKARRPKLTKDLTVHLVYGVFKLLDEWNLLCCQANIG